MPEDGPHRQNRVWIGAAVLETLLLFLTLFLPPELPQKLGVFGFGTLLIWCVAIVGARHVAKPVRPEDAPHNVLCIGADLRRIYFENGRLLSTSYDYDEDRDTRLAVIAQFANVPRTDRAVGPARDVRAIVAPVARSLRIPGGYWLNSSHNSIDLETANPAKELVLIYVMDDGSVWTLEDLQESPDNPISPRQHCIFSVGHMMGGLSVTVQLCSGGEVLNRSAFSIDLHPPHGLLPLEVALYHEDQFHDGHAVQVDDPDSPIWRPPPQPPAIEE